ncbi:MAG: TraK family protein [Planctomycetota bacterium]|jgi:hypothetical protein|nr:TraK family protein [Planctomycetota bacterium]
MEKKSLLQLLAERSVGDGSDRRARNYAVFLAVKDEVAEAFEQGWSLRRIWRVLKDEGGIPFGYDAFRRYVRRCIWGRPEKEAEPPNPSPAVEPEKAIQGRAMPDWPKPGTGAASKTASNSYKGEMPVYGRKSRPGDFGKF